MVKTAERVTKRQPSVESCTHLKALETLSRTLALADSREGLYGAVVSAAVSALQLASACLLVRRGDGSFESAAGGGLRAEENPSLEVRCDSPLVTWLRLNRDLLWREHLSILPELQPMGMEDRRKLDYWEAEVYCPLGTDDLAGILILGPKLREERYSIEDMQFLVALVRQASLELENSRLRELVRARRDRAEPPNADRDTFLNALAHEMKNPLTSAISSSELLVSRLSSHVSGQAEDIRLLAEDIRSAAQTLERTVSDILESGKVSLAALKCTLQPVELCQVAARLKREISPLLANRQQGLTLSLPPAPAWVRADPVRLKQVLYNLLTNASKFSPPGSELVLRALVNDRSIRIEAQDCAEPVPAEERERIFAPYYRGRAARGGGVPGLGLGLFVCKQLMELQQGRIWLAEEQPGGNIFCISLPKGG